MRFHAGEGVTLPKGNPDYAFRMKVSDIPQLQSASLSAKLELLDDLWSEIASRAGELPLPAWHVRELDQSQAEYDTNPREGRPWSEIREELLRRKP